MQVTERQLFHEVCTVLPEADERLRREPVSTVAPLESLQSSAASVTILVGPAAPLHVKRDDAHGHLCHNVIFLNGSFELLEASRKLSKVAANGITECYNVSKTSWHVLEIVVASHRCKANVA